MTERRTSRGFISTWLPATNVRRIIFVLFAIYAVIQVVRGIYQFFTWEQSDLELLRDFVLGVLDGEAVSTPNPPHSMLLVAPIYVLPLPVARGVMLILSIVLIWFIWKRLSDVLQLSMESRAWFLVLFLCWVSVRVTLAHGQLGIVAVAALVWAWTSRRARPWGLAIATVKPSISFSVLLDQLFRRPLVLLPSLGVVVAGMIWFLMATGLPPGDLPSHLLEAMARPQESGVGIDVTSALDRTLGLGSASIWIVGIVWLVAFWILRKRVRHPIVLLAVLLAMSMLPVYHRFYDLVALVPALAVFLKWRPLGFALAMTVGLAGVDTWLLTQGFIDTSVGRVILGWYMPLLVVAVIALAVRIDSGLAVNTSEDIGDADVDSLASRPA